MRFPQLEDSLLEAVLDGIEEGILVADAAGRVVFVSKGAREQFGLTAKEDALRLRDIAGVNMQRCITRALIEAGFDDAVSRRQDRFVVFEQAFDRPEGRRHFRIRTGLVRQESGDDLRLLLFKDVTDVKRLRAQLSAGESSEFITDDPKMREVLAQVKQAAATQAYVLLQGESGLGKTLLARMLHRGSPRSHRPLVEVNCAAIPDALLESEFFGHVKGAFTGALGDRPGRFEAADGGTLFLDEVGELPLHLQAKLLRAVQEQSFEPVGSNKTRCVDVRIVAASNRDLKDAVNSRLFRADLYYRLGVFRVRIPPLRERKSDIALLARHFLEQLHARGYPRVTLGEAALRVLLDYPWPGNVRELHNAIEHAVICAAGGIIVPDSLPQDILAYHGGMRPPRAAGFAPATDDQLRGQILFALKRSEGSKVGAARMLGIDRITLWRRMKRLGL